MLLVVCVPPDDIDEASGLVWSSDLATVIVEQAAPDGQVDLRVGSGRRRRAGVGRRPGVLVGHPLGGRSGRRGR